MAGLLLSKLGVDDIPVKILRIAQQQDPSDFWVNLELGSALHRTQRWGEATEYFRIAAALRPAHNVA